MTKREEVLRELLSLYRDLSDPCQSGNGNTGEAGWGLSMPATWTPSVRELERLLKVMREDRHASLVVVGAEKVSVRKLHWHLSEQFIRSTTKIGWETVRRRNVKGKMVKERVRAIVQVVDKGVRPELVSAGVTWLAENWGIGSEPMLPKQVMESRSQVAGLEAAA